MSSRLKGWMESRLVGEKGGGTIGQISSDTDYSMAIALVSGKEEGTCVFRYNFSSSHPVSTILRYRYNVRLDLNSSSQRIPCHDEVCIIKECRDKFRGKSNGYVIFRS